MARTPNNFSLNNQLSTTAESLNDAVLSTSQAIIRKLSFYNSNSTTSRVVTVYMVESGGAADAGNTLVVKTIPPLKSWNCLEIQGEVLEQGMTVQASQDSGTDVNTNMSGTTIT